MAAEANFSCLQTSQGCRRPKHLARAQLLPAQPLLSPREPRWGRAPAPRPLIPLSLCRVWGAPAAKGEQGTEPREGDRATRGGTESGKGGQSQEKGGQSQERGDRAKRGGQNQTRGDRAKPGPCPHDQGRGRWAWPGGRGQANGAGGVAGAWPGLCPLPRRAGGAVAGSAGTGALGPVV